MLCVVWWLGVEVMVSHSVALDERARGRRVRDDSEHCSGGGGGRSLVLRLLGGL